MDTRDTLLFLALRGVSQLSCLSYDPTDNKNGV